MQSTATKFIELMQKMKLHNCKLVVNPNSEIPGQLSVKVKNNITKKEVEQLLPHSHNDIESIVFCADYCIKKLITTKKANRTHGKAK